MMNINTNFTQYSTLRKIIILVILAIFIFICFIIFWWWTNPLLGSKSDTTSAVKGTKWGGNVNITFQDNTFHYKSDGIPNHTLNDEYVMPDNFSICIAHPTKDCTHIEPKSDAIKGRNIEYTITTNPQKVERVFTIPFGPMGVMISGAPVYNPFEGDTYTVAMNANFNLSNSKGQPIAFMDECNGHPSPHPWAQYHYHGLPKCITAQVDQPNGPSHIIGFALDGFPIYGDRDIDGNPIDPTKLDQCNGIESPTSEFPNGIYHYILLDIPTVQSTIRCLHGRLDAGIIPGLFPSL